MSTFSSPVNAKALLRQAEHLLRLQRFAEAEAVYAGLEQAFPGDAAILNGKAILLNKTGRTDAAIGLWRELLARHPDMPAPLINIGLAQRAAGRVAEAIASFEAALAAQPSLFDAHFNLGATFLAAGLHDRAIAHLEAAAAARPGHARTAVLLVQAAQGICDWARIEAAMPFLAAEAARAEADRPCAITPWLSLRLPLDRRQRLAIAATAARPYLAAARPDALPAPSPTGPADGRLTVGYISGDFRPHPLMHLAAGLFKRHDRDRFRIHAYPVNRPDAESARILQEGCDRVTGLDGLDDRAAAAQIRADGVDILVDLSGPNRLMRPGILAWRPAPLQMLYLGFAGTMGGKLHDCLIGDAVVTPPEHDGDYAETVLRLPGSYQINDCDQVIGAPVTRRQAGLPETGVVYACFCSADKIERAVFATWMAVLRAVPGSVLWLLGGVPMLQANLCAAAEAAGVSAHRLVFAGWRPKPEHLARLALADMHFDTGTYGAHTTGSDALWAGVPLITVCGDALPARVGTSLLQAAGLPGLVCADWDAYRQLAIELGHDAVRRDALRHAVLAARQSALFDTRQTVRHLERLYEDAWAARDEPAVAVSQL